MTHPAEATNGVTAFRIILPGLALTSGLAALAVIIQRTSGLSALSPLMLAMVLGMAVRNLVGVGPAATLGIKFSLRRILRLSIMLLGFQLTYTQIVDMGLVGFAAAAGILVVTFVFIKWIGRLLGVAPALAELIAAGTAVCGASAVIATNTVTRGSDEDIAYAIACVTVFGSIAMLALPLLAPLLGIEGTTFGWWAGASIHEVAQVTAATFQGGLEATQSGTVAKLSRVVLLAPLILVLAALARRRGHAAGTGAPPMPWFVFGFLAVVAMNSVWPVTGATKDVIVTVTTLLLTISLAAMGLETDTRKLGALGWRALALGAIGSIFISGLAYAALGAI
ncbi:YeiH family protein [Oryzicola mucosus]|uniref:Putative sulfate exporter family transporter n=1 Tax=Oryzicola mucosus TaxID=2767425 RepID=A0A8J6PZS9_9HYPH|nr:putative sulfate exporter family transporter [Oryzicola mucosus]MBD0417392.1 putative sulfate exporter family transporter [Oryzicola mucosus]